MVLIDIHTVPHRKEPLRLYDYVRTAFPSIPSRKQAKKLLDKGSFHVNGQKAGTGTWIKPGDRIDFFDLQIKPPKAYPLELDVIYQDQYLAIVHKPAGVPVSGNFYKTMVNAMVSQIPLSKEQDALAWLKPAHRLDAPTSGLLIVGKTHSCLRLLGELFVSKKISKTYHAVVKGSIPVGGKIGIPLDGKHSETVFKKLKEVPSRRNEGLSLVELHPKTGRTHQLRRHLSYIGHPIIGDKEYDDPKETVTHKGLFLCAVGLSFEHPITKEQLDFSIPTPHKFDSFMQRMQRYK